MSSMYTEQQWLKSRINVVHHGLEPARGIFHCHQYQHDSSLHRRKWGTHIREGA